MLFAGNDKAGGRLWPYWWCFLFGGNYRQKVGGYGWTPGVYRLTVRYYKENWKEAGYTWVQFVGLKKRKWPGITEIEAILDSKEKLDVAINPDGSVRAVPKKGME